MAEKMIKKCRKEHENSRKNPKKPSKIKGFSGLAENCYFDFN
ncbi:hypothetical protein [Enterocloster sp.]